MGFKQDSSGQQIASLTSFFYFKFISIKLLMHFKQKEWLQFVNFSNSLKSSKQISQVFKLVF